MEYILPRESWPTSPERHEHDASRSTILLSYCDNPKEVKEFVGHSDIAVTLEIYDRIKSKASKEKLANIMASLLEYDPA